MQITFVIKSYKNIDFRNPFPITQTAESVFQKPSIDIACVNLHFAKKSLTLPVHFSNYLHLISTTPLTLETAILYGYTYSAYKMFLYSVIDLHCAIRKSQKTRHTSWQGSRNKDWLD